MTSKKEALLLRVPKDLKERLQGIAEEKGISTTALIILALHDYCNQIHLDARR